MDIRNISSSIEMLIDPEYLWLNSQTSHVIETIAPASATQYDPGVSHHTMRTM